MSDTEIGGGETLLAKIGREFVKWMTLWHETGGEVEAVMGGILKALISIIMCTPFGHVIDTLTWIKLEEDEEVN